MERALEGIKVLDLTSSLTGILTTKYLADHGATVIWIESKEHLDVSRYSPPFKGGQADVNACALATTGITSRYSFGLNMKAPQAKDVLSKLVRWCDVIVESFRPGVLKKWGFDYAQASLLNPEIIMLSISIFGQTGPRAQTPGWGYYTMGFQGLPNCTGWPDRPGVSTPMAYTDTSTPWLGFSAIMAALFYREQTGKGQYIDFSQLEAGLHFMPGYRLLEYSVNGRDIDRNGNHDPCACPHSVYPCLGEDWWCAICIFTDEEWKRFCSTIDMPAWIDDPRFSTLRSRKQNEDKLDVLIAQWTNNLPPEDIMHLLQSEGIACGIVQNSSDLMERDPQLRYRGYWKTLSRPGLEGVRHPGWPANLSRTSCEVRPSPRFCEHTEMVCREFLNMNDEEIAILLRKGVLETGD